MAFKVQAGDSDSIKQGEVNAIIAVNASWMCLVT